MVVSGSLRLHIRIAGVQWNPYSHPLAVKKDGYQAFTDKSQEVGNKDLSAEAFVREEAKA